MFIGRWSSLLAIWHRLKSLKSETKSSSLTARSGS